MIGKPLTRWKCPDCGERWTDIDPTVCPYCDSHSAIACQPDWMDGLPDEQDEQPDF